MLITCIIPTFNRVDFLKEAINSILQQTYTNWELLVVDDQSTDNTRQMVADIEKIDPRVKYIYNKNKGGNYARNLGIELAKGDYIAFLDDDDISLPNRFMVQSLAARQSNSRYVVSAYKVVDRDSGKVFREGENELYGVSAGFPSRWLVKKDLLLEAGCFDVNMQAMQDIDLSYRLGAIESFVFNSNIVATIYPSAVSVTSNKERTMLAQIKLIEKYSSTLPVKETALLHFSLAIRYNSIGKNAEAIKHVRNAWKIDASLLNRTNMAILCTGYLVGLMKQAFSVTYRLNRKFFKPFCYHRTITINES